MFAASLEALATACVDAASQACALARGKCSTAAQFTNERAGRHDEGGFAVDLRSAVMGRSFDPAPLGDGVLHPPAFCAGGPEQLRAAADGRRKGAEHHRRVASEWTRWFKWTAKVQEDCRLAAGAAPAATVPAVAVVADPPRAPAEEPRRHQPEKVVVVADVRKADADAVRAQAEAAERARMAAKEAEAQQRAAQLAREREAEAARVQQREREAEAARQRARELEAARARELEAAKARELELAKAKEQAALKAKELEAARVQAEAAAKAREQAATKAKELETARAKELVAAKAKELEAAKAREQEALKAKELEAAKAKEQEAARAREEQLEAAKDRAREQARAQEREAQAAKDREAAAAREREQAQQRAVEAKVLGEREAKRQQETQRAEALRLEEAERRRQAEQGLKAREQAEEERRQQVHVALAKARDEENVRIERLKQEKAELHRREAEQRQKLVQALAEQDAQKRSELDAELAKADVELKQRLESLSRETLESEAKRQELAERELRMASDAESERRAKAEKEISQVADAVDPTLRLRAHLGLGVAGAGLSVGSTGAPGLGSFLLGAHASGHYGFWFEAPAEGLSSGLDAALFADLLLRTATGGPSYRLSGVAQLRYWIGRLGVGAAADLRASDAAPGALPPTPQLSFGPAVNLAIVDDAQLRVLAGVRWTPLPDTRWDRAALHLEAGYGMVFLAVDAGTVRSAGEDGFFLTSSLGIRARFR